MTDLGACFSDEIFMVDASNWGEAVVASSLEVGLQSEIHRHCLNKSCWTKLLTPFKEHLRGKDALDLIEELPGEQEPYTEHPIWRARRDPCPGTLPPQGVILFTEPHSELNAGLVVVCAATNLSLIWQS